jgi:hypothetical protein
MEAAAYPRSAPDHTITLNYTGSRLAPDPEILPVRVGDTVEFLQNGAPAGRTLAIMFDNPEYFSAATYKQGDDPIAVTGRVPPGAGTYRCKLLGAAEDPDASAGTPGGAIIIET